MTPTTLAYLAGLWDGEGSVAVYRAGRRFRLCVQLTQNSSRSADHLVEELPLLFGGSITRSTKKGREVLTWKVTHVPALHFLTTIQPWVRLKREELELAVAWAYGGAGDGEDVMVELKRLKRSWDK